MVSCTLRPGEGAACPAAVESSAGAGVGEHPYPPRGRGGICPPGHAVFDREGFLRNAPPGTEGVLSRQDSFSSAAYRHQLQIPGDDRVSRRLRAGDWLSALRAQESRGSGCGGESLLAGNTKMLRPAENQIAA